MLYNHSREEGLVSPFIYAVENLFRVGVERLFLVLHIKEDVHIDYDFHSFLNLCWKEIEDSGIGFPRERISESF